MPQPAVIVIGAGMLQVPMIKEAKALGLYVVATDKRPDADGMQIADEFMAIDTYDVAGHQELAEWFRDHPQKDVTVRGVVCCGNECAHTVAAVAEVLEVRGIPYAIARMTRDKRRVREALSNAHLDIYQPRWICGAGHASFVGNAIATRHLCGGYPVVVKPLRERASRGVSIVRHSQDLANAFAIARTYGEEHLIEELLTGTEHSAEIIFGESGDVLWFNIVDRFFDYSSNIPIEVGHCNPTRLDEHAQQQILLMMLSAAKALGVHFGPFKVDCMITADGPKVLEVTARLSGGWDCQWTSPATDRHPMQLLLQLACNLPLDMQPQMDGADGYAACAAIIPQKSGILQKINLPLWAHSGEALRDTQMDRAVVMGAKEGDAIAPLEHNAQRIGYVMAHACTYDAAWEHAKTVADKIAAAMEIAPAV